MAITSIQRDLNNNVSLVRMTSTDSVATIATTDYVANQQSTIDALNGGVFDWRMTDMVMVAASDGNAFYYFKDSTFATLSIYAEQGSGTVNPGLVNQVAYYPVNGSSISGIPTLANGTLVTSGVGAPSISQSLPITVQANIDTVGTVVSGLWQSTAVAVPYGGTGNTTFTSYSLICAGTTSTGAFQNVVGTGTAGDLLVSNGAGSLPSWQSGVASGFINTGNLNDLPYYSNSPSGRTLSAIAGANSSVLITSGLGVPSLSQTLPSAVQANITSVGTIGSGTWNGSAVTVPYGGTGNTTFTAYSVLCAGTTATGSFQNVSGVGASGQALVSNGAGLLPSWQTVGAAYTPSALTRVDDTNVTLTLGGTPATALLQATSITAGWSGQLSPARGGTGVNNGTSTFTIGGNFTMTGAFIFNGTLTGNTAVTFPTSGTLATTSQLPTPAALTRVDDANVTLTLGGSPSTALLQATSITAGWSGQLSPARGGTGVNNGTNTLTLAGNLATSGAFASTFTMTAATSVTFPTSGTLATTSQLPTPAALTRVDDTNITLTLGGTPSTALLQATSITAGWSGQLSLARGGTNADLSAAASNGGIVWSNATQMQILAGTATASKMLLSGSNATPSWSISTIPSSAGATANKLLLSDGTNYVLSTPTFPNASATTRKIIVSDGTNWIASTETWATPGTSGNVLTSNGTNWTSAAPTGGSSGLTALNYLLMGG